MPGRPDTHHGGLVFEVDLADGSGPGLFRDVTGLGVTIEVTTFREGSDPSTTHKLPGARHFTDVTLTRAMTDLRLWQWISANPPPPRTVSIVALDHEGRRLASYQLHHAWPCGWRGPYREPDGPDAAMESLQLTYEGLQVT